MRAIGAENKAFRRRLGPGSWIVAQDGLEMLEEEAAESSLLLVAGAELLPQLSPEDGLRPAESHRPKAAPSEPGVEIDSEGRADLPDRLEIDWHGSVHDEVIEGLRQDQEILA